MIEHALDGVSQPLLLTNSTPIVISRGRAINARFRPGSIFSTVIQKITGKTTATCGECGQHMRQMNEWGWWGCWKNRKTIIGWLREEAAKRGHDISDRAALDPLRAAFKELKHSH
jgi:hypothetical protein